MLFTVNFLIFQASKFGDFKRRTYVQKMVLDDTDTNILRMCVQLLFVVEINSKLYFAASYFGDF